MTKVLLDFAPKSPGISMSKSLNGFSQLKKRLLGIPDFENRSFNRRAYRKTESLALYFAIWFFSHMRPARSPIPNPATRAIFHFRIVNTIALTVKIARENEPLIQKPIKIQVDQES